MSHIFLSYERSDKAFALQLKHYLEQQGHEVWLDTVRLRAGDDWRAEIDNAIQQAAAMLVVMSPRANASEYVTYEWAYALGLGITVIPVLIRPVRMHPRLNMIHYFDFTQRAIMPWSSLGARLAPLVQQHPTSQLLSHDTPTYIQSAFLALDNPNPQDRMAAIKSLVDLQHPAARSILLMALDHPYPDVRAAAAKAVGSLRETQGIDALIAQLTDSQSSVRQSAAEALGKIGDKRALEPLFSLFGDSETAVRMTALTAINMLPDIAVTEYLCQQLRHPEAIYRQHAAMTLQSRNDEGALDALFASLHDADSAVRYFATLALGEISGERVIDPLIKQLQDDDHDVRQMALVSLSKHCEDPLDRTLLRQDRSQRVYIPDVREPIDEVFIYLAAKEHGVTTDEIRQRFEALAKRYHLKLGWNMEDKRAEGASRAG